MNIFTNTKKVYKTNLQLISSIFCITLTTLLINIISTINIDMLPETIKTSFISYPFLEENKFIVLAILFLINVFLGYIQLIHFFTIGGRKWIIKQFIPTIFYSLFSGRINYLLSSPERFENFDENWYRVTCYKYIDIRTTPINFIYEYVKRTVRWKRYRGRKLKLKNGYLVCFYRYGLEKNSIKEDYTSVTYQVKSNNKLEDKSNIRGIAGLTYIEEKDKVLSLDNNINAILEKIINASRLQDVNNLLYDKEIENENIEKNISKMSSVFNNLENAAKLELDDNEKNKIISFMKETNTDFNAMFRISQGKHSEHFVGFCIKGKKKIPWGVVVIDAYERDSATFWEIICPKTRLASDEKHIVGEEWLDCMINSYMGILSSSISRIIFEKEV